VNYSLRIELHRNLTPLFLFKNLFEGHVPLRVIFFKAARVGYLGSSPIPAPLCRSNQAPLARDGQIGNQRYAGTWIALALILVLFLSLTYLALPGLQYDEVNFVNAALGRENAQFIAWDATVLEWLCLYRRGILPWI
jgi:hypothetical protein